MPPYLPFAVAWGWMLLVVLASIVYRKRKGRPIWAADVADALFVEKRASGVSRRTWWTKLGGARNALYVAVTPTTLIVRPHFPFNLMFMPEVYGLELTLPVTTLRDVESVRKFGQDAARITFETPSGATEAFDLMLRNRPAFFDALARAGRSASAGASA